MHFSFICSSHDDYDADVAAIVGVDGAGGVDQRNAVLQSEARAGAYLTFIALRELYAQTCGDEAAFERAEGDRFGNVGAHVHTRSRVGLIGGELVG